MSKRVKEMLIDDVGRRLRGVRDVLVVNSSKLDGVTANKLRLAMRKKNISSLTVRNKLAKKALQGAGLELISQIATLLTSPGAQLAAAMIGPGAKLASQVQKIAEKEEQAAG
jgi:ribosomal protein L10